MRSIPVHTASQSYSVVVESGLLDSLGARLKKICGPQPSLFIVSSPEIWSLWGKRLQRSLAAKGTSIHTLFVPPGEQHKRLATIERLAEEMSQAGAKRDALLVAFGGGVIGDMTGFLAAIYMRGVPYIQIPTTYLAQIDSSVGGKTGVNLRTGKNLIGSFHQPAAVFCDPQVLSTLPGAELRAGLVESVKAAVLGDGRYFRWLENNIDALLRGDLKARTQAIQTSVRIKTEIVSADEREQGRRMLLNLGHTVGHAIEAVTRYRSLLHGEAIAWGMIAAVRLAYMRGTLTAAETHRVEALLYRLGPFPRFRASATALLERTGADKKHTQRARRFVLPVAIGEAIVVEDVSEPELRAAIDSMLAAMKERGR